MPRFLALLFFLFLASPAQAQIENFSPGENTFKAEPNSNLPAPEPSEPFPFIALSLGIVVLLCVSPFAIQYFAEMSKEMRSAQKGDSPPRKTKP